ncbi:MAG: YetF domain-containing protein, partial [Bacteroidota bacterium]
LLNFTFKSFIFKSKKLQTFVEGTPVILVNAGETVTENLRHEKITMTELLSAIREHGVNSIEEVKFAILEPDGNISVISYEGGVHTSHKRKKTKPILNSE